MAITLSANRQSVDAARKKLEAFEATSIEERAQAAKKFSDDEYAAMAGVVTLTQAEATFIDLNVRAYNDMADCFVEFVPLAIGEIPIYKERHEYPVRVNMGHLAGGPPAVKWGTVQTGVQVTPFQYFSEEILVPNLVNVSFDISKFHEKEQALARLARDMKLARQKFVLNLMLNAPLNQALPLSLSNYMASTPFVGNTVYILDPTVDPNSIAQTNIISATTEHGLTLNLFKAIASQMILQGRKAVNMFIPISGKPWEGYWNQASVVAFSTSGTSSVQNTDPNRAIPPSKWEEAVNMGFTENGQYMDWFGNHIFVQPTNILPAGYFVVSTNMPAVLGWDQLDKSVSDEDPLGGRMREMSKRYEARSIALAQPGPLLLNFAVGQFASP